MFASFFKTCMSGVGLFAWFVLAAAVRYVLWGCHVVERPCDDFPKVFILARMIFLCILGEGRETRLGLAGYGNASMEGFAHIATRRQVRHMQVLFLPPSSAPILKSHVQFLTAFSNGRTLDVDLT